jgi:hypothetical protein
MPFKTSKSKTELTIENRKLRNLLSIIRSENNLKLKKKDETIKHLRKEIVRLNKKFILYFQSVDLDTDSETDYETTTGTEIDIHCSDTDSDEDTHKRKNIFN